MRKITQSCAELLVKCKWENIEFNCMDLFAQSFTIDGLCCSFNYYMARYVHHNFEIDSSNCDIDSLYSPKGPERESKVKYSSYYGFESGLQVLVDPMVQPIQYSKYSASGIKVRMHASLCRTVTVRFIRWYCTTRSITPPRAPYRGLCLLDIWLTFNCVWMSCGSVEKWRRCLSNRGTVCIPMRGGCTRFKPSTRTQTVWKSAILICSRKCAIAYLIITVWKVLMAVWIIDHLRFSNHISHLSQIFDLNLDDGAKNINFYSQSVNKMEMPKRISSAI